eukprot:gene4135-69_t
MALEKERKRKLAPTKVFIGMYNEGTSHPSSDTSFPTSQCFLRKNEGRSFGICIASVPRKCPIPRYQKHLRIGQNYSTNGKKAHKYYSYPVQSSSHVSYIHTVDSIGHGGALRPVCGTSAPKPGDTILQVNGKDVSSLDHDHVIELIRESGDILHLTLALEPDTLLIRKPRDDHGAPMSSPEVGKFQQGRLEPQVATGPYSNYDNDDSPKSVTSTSSKLYSRWGAIHRWAQGHVDMETTNLQLASNGVDTDNRAEHASSGRVLRVSNHHCPSYREISRSSPHNITSGKLEGVYTPSLSPHNHSQSVRGATELPNPISPAAMRKSAQLNNSISPKSAASGHSARRQVRNTHPLRHPGICGEVLVSFGCHGPRGVVFLEGDGLKSCAIGTLAVTLRSQCLLHAHACYTQSVNTGTNLGQRTTFRTNQTDSLARTTSVKSARTAPPSHVTPLQTRQMSARTLPGTIFTPINKSERVACAELVANVARSHALFLVVVCRVLSWLHTRRFRFASMSVEQNVGQLCLVEIPKTLTMHGPAPLSVSEAAAEAAAAALATQFNSCSFRNEKRLHNGKSIELHSHNHLSAHQSQESAWFAAHVSDIYITLVDAPPVTIEIVTDVIQDIVDKIADDSHVNDFQVLHRTHEPGIDVYDVAVLSQLGAKTPISLFCSVEASLAVAGWTCTPMPILQGVENSTCHLFTRQRSEVL